LRGAYLRGADLYGADLRGADLYGADLRGANLYGANLCEKYLQIKGSKAWLVGFGDKIQIDCEDHTVIEWQQEYEAIGKKNGYTDDEIKEYKSYIDFYASMVMK
jgi:hypothetical protein